MTSGQAEWGCKSYCLLCLVPLSEVWWGRGRGVGSLGD